MMAEKDPYGVLGVSKGASDGEIKRAFRKKARQFHPDRNPGDATSEAKFKEVQSAYDKIGDAESRHEHDQQEQMANMFGGGRRGGSQFGGMGGGHGFEDALGQMFGGGMRGGSPFGGSQRPRSQKRAKGSDITVGLDITMEEAANGGTFSFTFKRLKSNSAGTMEAASTSLKTKLEPSVKHGAIRRLKGQGHDHPVVL
jgi:molecular chaperone DnaJ